MADSPRCPNSAPSFVPLRNVEASGRASACDPSGSVASIAANAAGVEILITLRIEGGRSPSNSIVSEGREARLQRAPRKRPESAPKPSFPLRARNRPHRPFLDSREGFGALVTTARVIVPPQDLKDGAEGTGRLCQTKYRRRLCPWVGESVRPIFRKLREIAGISVDLETACVPWDFLVVDAVLPNRSPSRGFPANRENNRENAREGEVKRA
jgi:hypothetical protein